jgi:hypothetical protein
MHDSPSQVVRSLVEEAVSQASSSTDACYNGFTTLLELLTKEGFRDSKVSDGCRDH